MCTAVTLHGFELGKNDATIYFNKKNRRAAEEMAHFLNRVYGKKYTTALFKASDAKKAGIFVGIVPANTKFDLPAEKYKEYCVTHITDKQIFLFGNDGARLQGTYFAVSDFLEKFCGIRFLWPGELGTVVPKRSPETLAAGTTVFVPKFDVRMTNSFTYGVNSLIWEDRVALSKWQDRRKVGRSIHAYSGSGFQHAFKSLMPREKYGKEHPEYYALVKPENWIGTPKPTVPTRLNNPHQSGPWQLCTSNPEVRRIIAEKLAARNTDRIQSISPNDGFGWCECDRCLAQDGPNWRIHSRNVRDLTNRMYDFVADIARQAKAINPKTRVGMFAYSFYDGVPDNGVKLPDNVFLSYCYIVYRAADAEDENIINKTISGLSAIGGKVIGREYWGTHYTMEYPLYQSRKIDRNLKLLANCNAAGIYGETGKSFAVRSPDLYVLTKLSWDPTLKREELLKDFCDSAFGPKAGKVMYDLFEKIEDRTEAGVLKMKTVHGPNFHHYNNDYAEFNRMMSDLYTKEFIDECKRELGRAASLADTPERKARIAFLRTGILYAYNITETLKAYQDLAAAGIDMSLTVPSANQIVMEKDSLLALMDRAIKVSGAKKLYWLTKSQGNAIGRGDDKTTLGLRPWHTFAQKGRLQLLSNTYNYLVNNSFEYNGYSWDVKFNGKGSVKYTTAANCDAADNYMVQCHANQGISMELELAPGAEAVVTNLRPIATKKAALAHIRLFVRDDGDPAEKITAAFAGKTLKPIRIAPELKSFNNNWEELRFLPAPMAVGSHTFSFTVRNTGKKPLKLNFDQLSLQVK